MTGLVCVIIWLSCVLIAVLMLVYSICTEKNEKELKNTLNEEKRILDATIDAKKDNKLQLMWANKKLKHLSERFNNINNYCIELETFIKKILPTLPQNLQEEVINIFRHGGQNKE